MDSVKAKDVPQTSTTTKPMTRVEEYQRRWAQLMDDTAKQIQKIRGAQTQSSRTCLTSDISYAGSNNS